MAEPTIDRAVLAKLASINGVATEYWDYEGNETHIDTDVLLHVLRSVGAEPTDTDDATRLIHEHENASWLKTLEPTQVISRDNKWEFVVTVNAGEDFAATVQLEDGTSIVADNVLGTVVETIDGVERAKHYVALPQGVPDGYHEIEVEHSGETSRGFLMVAPAAVPEHQGLSTQRHGMAIQLYSTISKKSWGVGDFVDLAELATWAAGQGTDFVLINPIHAAAPTLPIEPSPYLPTTRRFINPIYLRVEEIREYAGLTSEDRKRLSAARRRVNKNVRDGGLISRDKTWKAKDKALRAVFAIERSAERDQEFAEFRETSGHELEQFALWSALSVHFGSKAWPEGLDTPNGDAVGVWRDKLTEEITYQCWLQWLCAEQLHGAQDAAKAAGMEYGVITDLAVGVHPAGADSWALQKSLAKNVTVGAPPDQMNQQGQDWSQPPWRPLGLAETGYSALRDVLRAALQTSGGVRMDHVMGLFRLWWIPTGRPASEGTYVYYDKDAMMAVLKIEATRAGAVVVGEDLGTVEPYVREELAKAGVLGTSVLWFENTPDGLIPPDQWRSNTFATVTTHDLPPTASYLTSEHVDFRDSLGLLARPADEERAEAQAEVERVLQSVRDQGLLDQDNPTEAQTVAALHEFLAKTPARLIGWSLTDAVGERRLQNQPGTSTEYTNWQVPLGGGDGTTLTIEDVLVSHRATEFLQALNGALAE